mgnify:CR=1 FL=1
MRKAEIYLYDRLAGLLVADMLRHMINVIHQRNRVAERIGIDILNQERLGTAVRQSEIHFVCTIHIAHLNGLIAQEFIINPEQLADLMQLFIQFHITRILS